MPPNTEIFLGVYDYAGKADQLGESPGGGGGGTSL